MCARKRCSPAARRGRAAAALIPNSRVAILIYIACASSGDEGSARGIRETSNKALTFLTLPGTVFGTRPTWVASSCQREGRRHRRERERVRESRQNLRTALAAHLPAAFSHTFPEFRVHIIRTRQTN